LNKIRVYKDTLSKEQQDYIEQTLLGIPNSFPWYFIDDVTYPGAKKPRPALIHNIVMGSRVNSDFMNLIQLFNIVPEKNIVQARAILQLPLNEKLIGKKYDTPHIDMNIPHNVYLYYVCDSDGETVFFENKKIIKKIKPKKGTLVVFDGAIYHTAFQPKKSKRCIINIDVAR